jgi:hypothetical protein
MRRRRGELRLRFPLAALDTLLFFLLAVLLRDEDCFEDWVDD